MLEITISGAIKWTDTRSSSNPDGLYIIRNNYGHGWGIPTIDLNPEDLRVMAAHLEQTRASITQ